MAAERQTTANVLLVRPHHFAPNPETAASNVFQRSADARPSSLQARALAEFEGVVTALGHAGVRALVFEDTDRPAKPDAVFPNNWFSTHADGTVILYPLEAPSRRAERRRDIIESLSADHGFYVRQILDLSDLEGRGMFLEGTGSLVLDRSSRVAYACWSSRTHPEALADFAQQADYEIVAFDAVDVDGQPIYHTNVMLSIGGSFAVLCAEAISERQREAVLSRLTATGHELITITQAQMGAFAGNLLELATAEDSAVIIISRTALDSLTPDQRAAMSAFGTLLPVDIDTIERVGGGSVRCMLAEIFLPARAAAI